MWSKVITIWGEESDGLISSPLEIATLLIFLLYIYIVHADYVS